MKRVLVTGAFDNLRRRHVRFLEEAAKLGELHVALWSDEMVKAQTGSPPKFPAAERLYFVEALRYVDSVHLPEGDGGGKRPFGADEARPQVWAVMAEEENEKARAYCREEGIEYHVVDEEALKTIPPAAEFEDNQEVGRRKVVVTGCFDWLHSGHVRFFEETSAYGDLYVVLGHDQNVQLLKGGGHPLFPAVERQYMVQAIRYVRQALVSSGEGWMDAAPEIALIKPDIYAVNEDGDKPEKQQFCEEQGLEYLVLRRLPKEGLKARESTALRGF